MAVAETAELVTRLSLKDGLSRGILSAQSKLKAFDRKTANTQRALGNFRSNIGTAITVGAAAAGAGLIGVVNAAADYESAFAGVRKTVDASESEFDALEQGFRNLAKTIPVSAVQLAGLGETAGALGIAQGDILGFAETAAKLGVTTNLSADEAADALGRVGTILGLTGKDFATFGSALVALGNEGASTESEIIEITKRFAASGKAAGLTADQILAYSSAISSAGVEQEAAGSSLSRLFSNLIKETALASDEGKSFAKVSGKSFKNFSKLVEEDTNGAMLLFLDSLSKLDKFEAARALQAVGITGVRDQDAIRKLAQTYNTNLIPALRLAGSAIADTSALDKEAGERFKTFQSQVTLLAQNINDAFITIGESLLPKITPLFNRITTFLNENQPALKEFGAQLASGFQQFADALLAINWGPIIDGFRTAVGLGKQAVDAFLKLPPDIQKSLVALFAVNKVTGGLITGVAKDVAGGIIKAATANVQAVNVTVVGRNVTGGPGGAPGAPSGPPGGRSTGRPDRPTSGSRGQVVTIGGAAAVDPFALAGTTPQAEFQSVMDALRAKGQFGGPRAGVAPLVGLTAAAIQAIQGPLTTAALYQQQQVERTGSLAESIRAQTTAAYAAIEAARLRPPPVVRITNTPPAIYFNVSTRDIQVAQQSKNRYGRAVQ